MNVLVVAPHPDDETLGCGGTLLKHRDAGDQVFWVVMTTMAPEVGYSVAQIQARAAEIAAVGRAYRCAKVFSLGFMTTMLDTRSLGALIDPLTQVVRDVQPVVVYLPHRGDIHSDHRVTFDAATAAVKTFRASSVKRVCAYETLSETEFAPPVPSEAFVPSGFSDITPYLEGKLEVMRLYAGELRPHPFPRSEENIRALATFRGAMSGFRYAESFFVIRELW